MNLKNLTSFNLPTYFLSYQVKVKPAIIATLTVIAVATLAIKYFHLYPKHDKQYFLSEEDFWNRVSNTPSLIKEDESVVIENTTNSTLVARQKECFLACTKTSDYVRKYLIQSDFKGTVLDLGCGVGANIIPLIAKGCDVTAIDKEKEIIQSYNANELNLGLAYLFNLDTLGKSTAIVGDITTYPYPNNMDAIICVDTLPYLSPSKLKETLNKIFQALRPGGKFIGTLFFTSGKKTSLIKTMEKLGAHFYQDKSFVRGMITRSGFQIKNETDRFDNGWFSRSFCVEFIAEKAP